jgi:hypothetical protein
MDTGSNKSLFTLIAVVIFGIFLSLSYWLFQDELKNVLANVMDKTSQSVNTKLNETLTTNVLKNADLKKSYIGNYWIDDYTNIDYMDCYVYSHDYNIAALNGDYILTQGKQYTFSFVAKASEPMNLGYVYINARNTNNLTNQIVTTEWMTYSFTFVANHNDTGYPASKPIDSVFLHMYPHMNTSDGTLGTFYIADWWLNEGDTTTFYQ